MKINVGVVGATGMVGEIFLELMAERGFPVGELRLFASKKSEGHKMTFQEREIEVKALSENCFSGLDLVFFSSGDDISKEWAPQAVHAGAFAVDNSAAFRMDAQTPLVVPEVNGHLIPDRGSPALIANPNCSTIQLVLLLKPLLQLGLKKVKVSSYQAVSGAGKEGRDELIDQLKDFLDGAGEVSFKVFPQQVAFNCFPQIGSFNEHGFCSEEMKIMSETKKILERAELKVSAFTVRIPAINSHAESVWAEFSREVSREEIEVALNGQQGLKFLKPRDQYTTPFQMSGKDEVMVSRIHQDLDDPSTWIFWVVADNLRKGAALNGIQIAEHIFG